ncbi:MAG: hypothetical protein K0V04_40255 [Deltaproteobacteria bacterium]|nr:hypothetical protein [Deltaproteobacteria bacterium]
MGQRRQHPSHAGLGSTLLMVVAAAVGTSCFNGSDAAGLPCRSDDDCGRGHSCIMELCGGPMASVGSTSVAGSTSSGGAGSSDGSSSSGGGPAVCGNAVIEDGEDCDPGGAVDTPLCDADCSLAVCGDTYVNGMANEGCDDGNDESVDGCTAQCMPTLFWDDMNEAPVTNNKWTGTIPEHISEDDAALFSLPSGWQYGVPEPGAWGSGVYHFDSGTVRLVSAPIVFPAPPLPPGMRYELRFSHRRRFDGNQMDLIPGVCDEPFSSDGGLVLLLEDGQPPRTIGPAPGHPDVLSDPGSCFDNLADPANPRFIPGAPQPVFAGLGPPEFIDEIVPITNVAGQTLQLAFEVSYDCSNCWQMPPPGAGWIIDDVVVAPFAAM